MKNKRIVLGILFGFVVAIFGTSFFASCTVFFMPCSVGCAGREQGRSFLFRMRAVS